MKLHPALVLLPLAILFLSAAVQDVDPAEDAHVTFRYAENLAAGNGLTYNGTERVYGCTEPGFAVMLAGIHASTGIDTREAAVTLNMLGLVVLILLLWRERTHARLVAALIVAISPAPLYAVLGFGMPLAASMVGIGLLLPRRPRFVLWAVAATVRPELHALAPVALYCSIRSKRPLDFLFLLVPAAVFLFMVWNYYGTPIPNTWTRKHDGAWWHPDSFAVTGIYLAAMLPLIPLLWRNRRRADLAVLLLIPVCYIAIEQWQNIGLRYQFWLVPAFVPFISFGDRHPAPAYVLAGIFAAIVLCSVGFVSMRYDERRTVGVMLSRQGGRLATTEVGWLPYFSRWETLDLFGLNRKGELDPKVIAEFRPDVIMFRSDALMQATLKGEPVELPVSADPRWHAIIEATLRYYLFEDCRQIVIPRTKDVLVYVVMAGPRQEWATKCIVDGYRAAR